MQMLKTVRLAGWKSIKDQTIELLPLNVFIGANASGKSNLISFFRFLNAMVAQAPRLREFVGTAGGANALLHFGSKQTPVLEAELTFATDNGESRYYARWVHAAGDTLIFAEERVEFLRDGYDRAQDVPLGAGHAESKLPEAAASGDKTADVMLHLLRRCRLFHFHDTSSEAAIRRPGYIEANRFLYPDGGNLAAMLYLYRDKHPATYQRIVGTLRQTISCFDEFVLDPQAMNPNNIVLNWKQRGSDYEFGPHQLSDGSIRFMALTTLLSQPSPMPLLMTLDEPELGLHPAALALLASMVKSATRESQLILATQSPALLDHFTADAVVVAANRDGVSEFQRLSADALHDWLDEYNLSELWEKNVVGGGPY